VDLLRKEKTGLVKKKRFVEGKSTRPFQWIEGGIPASDFPRANKTGPGKGQGEGRFHQQFFASKRRREEEKKS